VCFNVDLLLKAKDHDRIIVSNDPVNYFDPWGLKWVTTGHDYHGIKNWANSIGRHLSTLDEGKPFGTQPEHYEGNTRDAIQEWQHDPENPSRDSEHPIGTERKTPQEYQKKPSPRPPGYWDPSDYWWFPQVPPEGYDC